MTRVIYASFSDPLAGKSAVGALLDHGVLNEDISLVVNEEYMRLNPGFVYDDEHAGSSADANAKSGITTTTVADAGVGAVKGTVGGVVVGLLGALASLIIPGFGLVMGGGALAMALGAAAGTAAAGAITGGVIGYLKDQGLPEHEIEQLDGVVSKGGALLSVNAPSGNIEQPEIEALLVKYNAGILQSHPLRTEHVEVVETPHGEEVVTVEHTPLLAVAEAGGVDYVTPAEYVAPAAFVPPSSTPTV